ncbi:GNAT family N-acetyltransferase [Mycolicibacterium sp. P1-18]|uniref:GNAT family N-acetyltransferase n=1 Tax=Mycolicibacterium sp. P1-18 TaxID=2024615 RepID=UPI0011F19A35|nr:GNAT family N-acetyltransferase [Mycolicibacterium sp. P1-18]KAA0095958.1 GNAT family N-acetyltransferase [Mycolicibacterium sp. P1-18]
MLADQISPLAETAEAEFMYQYESSAAPTTKQTLGITTARIGGGVALSMRHDVTGYWSKALGFGVSEPVTAEILDEVVAFYVAEAATGAVIQIAPSLLPDDWSEIAGRHGLTPTSPWIKLAGAIDDVETSYTTNLSVRPVDPLDLPLWATTTLRGFGMPTVGLADMLAEAATQPGFRPFAAWDGDDMVATANLFVHGSVGSLNSTATLPTHRNRGAQSALIAVRAAAAADAGCHWLSAETGRPADGEVNPSLNNLLRHGLRPIYERENWAWSPAGS